MKRLFLIVLALLLLVGCVQTDDKVSATPSASAESHGTDVPVATVRLTPSPVPSPTPIFTDFGDNGDLQINAGLLSTLPARTYTVSKDTVILIYHTHAAEAYRQDGRYRYEETEENSYRTLDDSKNVVAVGVALKETLEGYGFTVVHDTTNVEAPELTSSYSRSLEVMEKYPEADIYIDLHRNAANVRFKQDDVVMLNGERCAKMFFVVGTGIGTYEGEYDAAPDWKSNYQLAFSITERLRQYDPEFALDIRTKVGRYNQHVGSMCLLLELGHNANTMDDVLNSVPYFAEAFSEVVLIDKNEPLQ